MGMQYGEFQSVEIRAPAMPQHGYGSSGRSRFRHDGGGSGMCRKGRSGIGNAAWIQRRANNIEGDRAVP